MIDLWRKTATPHQTQVAGPTLRYVAELDGQPVAILIFCSATLHRNARDQ